MDNTLLLNPARLILIITLAVLSISVHAKTSEPAPKFEDHLYIGVGATDNSAPYYGLDNYTTVVPAFSFRYGNIFGYNNHDEPVIGIELFQHKRISLAIAATSGRTELDVSEINQASYNELLYHGIKDRDRATEAGLMFRYFSRVGLFEAKVFHDISNTYDGFRSSLSMARPFPDTGKWTITPRIFAKYYSAKFNEYYYGVSLLEQQQGVQFAASYGSGISEYSYTSRVRNAFIPSNSAHYGIDLQLSYDIGTGFVAVGHIGLEQFSGQIEGSKLVEDDERVVSNIGLQYRF